MGRVAAPVCYQAVARYTASALVDKTVLRFAAPFAVLAVLIFVTKRAVDNFLLAAAGYIPLETLRTLLTHVFAFFGSLTLFLLTTVLSTLMTPLSRRCEALYEKYAQYPQASSSFIVYVPTRRQGFPPWMEATVNSISDIVNVFFIKAVLWLLAACLRILVATLLPSVFLWLLDYALFVFWAALSSVDFLWIPLLLRDAPCHERIRWLFRVTRYSADRRLAVLVFSLLFAALLQIDSAIHTVVPVLGVVAGTLFACELSVKAP